MLIRQENFFKKKKIHYEMEILAWSFNQCHIAFTSAPGYIGTFHLACQYGLIFYDFSKEEALSMAILLHAAGFIPTVILGLIIFLLQHISLRSLTNEQISLRKEKNLDI